MRNVLRLLLILLFFGALGFSYFRANALLSEQSERNATTRRELIVTASAAFVEPAFSRTSPSRTELHELGRRIDDLSEVQAVVLLYAPPGEAERNPYQVVYRTPTEMIAESAPWDTLLRKVTRDALLRATEAVGEIPEELRKLGLRIVDLVVAGGSGETGTLQRLDREFQRLYQEGNARLADLSRTLAAEVAVPTGRAGGHTVNLVAQPVLTLSRARTVDVSGVVLLRFTEADGTPDRPDLLTVLAPGYVLAGLVFVLALFLPTGPATTRR